MEYWGGCLDGYAIQSISFVGGGLIQHQNCVPPPSFFNTTCNKKKWYNNQYVYLYNNQKEYGGDCLDGYALQKMG